MVKVYNGLIYNLFNRKKIKPIVFLRMMILGAGLALSMSSCDRNTITDDEDVVYDDDGYMTIALQLPSQGVLTYAEEAGVGDEVKISTVTVVFFSTTDNKVLEIVDFSSSTPGDLTILGTTVTTRPIWLEKQDYDVVVLINRPASLTFTKDVTTKSDFEVAVTVSLNNLTSSTGFFMANATGYKRFYSFNFKSTQAASANAPVSMKVERAVAKVVVMASNSMPVTGGAVDKNDIYWAVDIKNTKMYWMRKQTRRLIYDGSNWIPGAIATENDFTSAGRDYLYAEDPNFTGHATTTEFVKLTAGDINHSLSSVSSPGAGYVAEYVPENTMQAEDQFRNVTTSVALKLVYVPDGITDAKTVGYYVYNRSITISDTDMKTYAADHDNIPASLPGLGNLLDEYGVDLTTTPTASFTYKNLSFYSKGLNYYNIPLRHFMIQNTLMGYGRYGVVRNTVYQLTLTAIKTPGYTAPDLQEWEDDSEAYLSVEFNIAPWYVRDQDVDL